MHKFTGEACLRSVPERFEVSWTFQIGGSRTVWDWTQGTPDVKTLEPVRQPQSGSRSRHAPVRAFSTTVGDHVELESGLEQDLLRVLDHDPDVRWIVAQPAALDWRPAGEHRSVAHTPDLLSVDGADGVTIWDVKRPEPASSETFAEKRAVAEKACADQGWRYEVFTGLTPIHRHNLMWLHAYRRRPPWASVYENDLIGEAQGGVLLGDLLKYGHDPDRVAVMWHLIWSGQLIADLTARLTATVEVSS